MVNAGISVSAAVSFMENEACESENLGFTRKDAYDHMSRLKKHTKVENGDVTVLIKYFINTANKENYFYWNVQLDDDDRNVMFDLAFMSDETESSFEWLFTAFLDSMNEKQPQAIFSDQCQAIMNAIETVFPHSHHRLYEFEATWKYMIDTYNLDDHRWLNGMYRLREKWATAFSSGRFSAGLLATSRSETTNMTGM
ncbi:protein FAR1-RELATED SEQUENCE 6-like [Primulina tabacum]|uniref:protein FAR1-RELATED SEQUENCE 6-like n=1 Tax=Primulina tabacum TaxID=48773 RepID=UPI003F590557